VGKALKRLEEYIPNGIIHSYNDIIYNDALIKVEDQVASDNYKWKIFI